MTKQNPFIANWESLHWIQDYLEKRSQHRSSRMLKSWESKIKRNLEKQAKKAELDYNWSPLTNEGTNQQEVGRRMDFLQGEISAFRLVQGDYQYEKLKEKASKGKFVLWGSPIKKEAKK